MSAGSFGSLVGEGWVPKASGALAYQAGEASGGEAGSYSNALSILLAVFVRC